MFMWKHVRSNSTQPHVLLWTPQDVHCAVTMYIPHSSFSSSLSASSLTRKELSERLSMADFWSDFFLHFRSMSQSMFLILLLPMALGQTSLRGREVKVTTVAHRPFIMPNNLSSGERLPEKLHKIVHHVSFPQIWRLPGWYDEGALNYAGFHFQHPR